jgi:DNA-binding protein
MVALHTAVNMAVVLAVVVAATETTTRAVATARGTKHCPAVADAVRHRSCSGDAESAGQSSDDVQRRV